MSKRNIFISLVIYVLLWGSFVYAQVEKNFNVIDRSKEYRVRIYFFITYPSCVGCVDNINVVLNMFKNEEDVEFVGFINSVDNNLDISIFKEKYKWSFRLVNDVMGIYYQYYKIQKENSLIILDNEGNIFKRIVFTSNPVSAIDSLIKKFPKKENIIDYHLIEDKTVFIDGIEYLGDNYYIPLFSEKSQTYFLFGKTDCKLLILNRDGTYKDLINLQNNISMLNPVTNSFSWLISDNKIIAKTNGFNREFKSSNLTFYYDIENKKLIKKITPDKAIDLSNYYVYGNKFNGSLIYSYNYFYNPKKIDQHNIKPLIIADTNDNVIKQIGNLPDIYLKLKIDEIYGMFVDFGSKNILTYQSYDSKVYKYDSSLNLIDSVMLHPSSNMRKPSTDYPKEFSYQNVLNFANTISIFYDFKYDETKDHFIFYYENRVSPPGNSDLNSPFIKYADYFAIYDSKGMLIKEFKIPDRSVRILNFENNTITYIVSIQNKVHFKKIKF